MECLSSRFTEETKEILDSSRTVIATVAVQGDGFIEQVKQRADCHMFIVTKKNRDSLADTVYQTFKQIQEIPA